MNKRIEKTVLNFCNKIRKELGKKPVTRLKKGIIDDCTECVVARTIGTGSWVRFAGEDYLEIWYGGIGNETIVCCTKSASVFNFVRDFDNGKYPELVAK